MTEVINTSVSVVCIIDGDIDGCACSKLKVVVVVAAVVVVGGGSGGGDGRNVNVSICKKSNLKNKRQYLHNKGMLQKHARTQKKTTNE